jgi:hypothetical protein
MSTWKKTDQLVGSRFRANNLDSAIAAGRACKEAERLYPGLFRAVSIRGGIMTVAVPPGGRIAVKMIEGALVPTLNAFSKERGLPEVSRLKIVNETELQD